MQEVSWSQVLHWRMRRQSLGDDRAADAVTVARRVAGVQAQVPSAAALAVAVRRSTPDPGAVDRALLDDRTLVRTWAMRGTLHLLPADEAPAYLAVCGAHRSWEKPSVQKASGVSVADFEGIAAAAAEALATGKALTREQLGAEIVDRTGSAHLAELLGSGWGTLLKPLSYWGVLCNGPSNGNRVTFVSPAAWVPGWPGVPALDDAAPTVIRAFLRAHGPSTPELFDKVWLSRGFTRKPVLRGWFAALADELANVRVDDQQRVMLAEDVPELLEQRPAESVRLLGGFDPYILGAGTGSVEVVPAAYRAEVSRTAGWISPVVLWGGRAAGTWSLEDATVRPSLWEDVPRTALEAEVERLGTCLDRPLSLGS